MKSDSNEQHSRTHHHKTQHSTKSHALRLSTLFTFSLKYLFRTCFVILSRNLALMDKLWNTGGGDGGGGDIIACLPFSNAEVLEEFTAETKKDVEDLWLKLKSSPFYFFQFNEGIDVTPVSEWDQARLDEYLERACAFAHMPTKPRTRQEILKSKFSEVGSLQTILLFYSEAFMLMEMSGVKHWSRLVTQRIRGGLKYAEMCVKKKDGMSGDYLPGVAFLKRWTQLHVYLKKGKIPPARFLPGTGDYHAQAEFNALPDKSKAIVLAAKCSFFGLFQHENRATRDVSLNALKEVAKLDPKSYEWHYPLGNWLRHSRRRACKASGSNVKMSWPTAEEIQALWETYDICDYNKTDLNDPSKNSALRNWALVGISQGVAEVIRCRHQTRQTDFPVTFEGLIFHTDSEMADFVLQNVNRAVAEQIPTYPELVRSGEILANILPYQYRDFKAAEKYLQKALDISPSSSKVNHKLGVLYLISKELHDVEKAKEFLWRAVKLESNNFPASIDLIHTLLRSPKENQTELDKLSIQLKHATCWSDWSEKNKSLICFAQGCRNFMTGDEDDAIKLWIKAQSGAQTINFIGGLFPIMKRHQWNRNLIDISRIRLVFESYIIAHPDMEESDKQAASKLLTELLFLNSRRPTTDQEENVQQGRARFSSVSDLDSDWRKSSRLGSLPFTIAASAQANSSRYIPPGRRSENINSSVQSYQNSGKYVSSVSSSRQRRHTDNANRPPSPVSWR